MGLYPMETVKRVEQPTTLIDAARVPRVPKRHDMFIRASIGDLGPKAQKELTDFRMITKSPFGHAMIPVLGGMVPLQYGEEAPTRTGGYDDPRTNSQIVKAAMYYLGADMVGICEIPDYAWYSHDLDGSEIEPYHKYAICILVDQGYETMEGASGDDWISGAQSMRAYMRAQLIGGTVGSHLRQLGFSARGHSVMDQDVLHIPLNLLAGLGELPRIGEMVLNPFVGPRFKSGILTTNMPLEPDLPIDFGMQDFCNKCLKCARECPCTAIPFGDKIMFNGYEMWKPDVEKCARYRITNAAGSMCGRCMKTCPFNLEGVMAEKPFLWSAMNLPFTRKWIADMDDKVGNGKINPVKKWWWDLDTDDEGNIVPAKRINARELEFRAMQPRDQKLACYPLETVPTPIEVQPSSPDRKQGVEFYRAASSPGEYREAMSIGEAPVTAKPDWLAR
jgi:reductive dehalogenase